MISAFALSTCSAWAQGTPLKLQKSLQPAPEGEELPVFVVADRLEGLTEGEIEASGNAEVRKGDMTLYADEIRYWQDSDEVEATGRVKLLNRGNEVEGPRAKIRLTDHTGIFEKPVFSLAPREVSTEDGVGSRRISIDKPLTQTIQSRGDGEALRFEGRDHYRLSGGRFTSCSPGQDDWYVNADELQIDMDREVVTARNASLSFMGATTPEFPWFEFPLNNNRKTGFLPPSVGVSGDSGFEAGLPFYWNIAPNYDATITPRFLEKRGMQVNNEFRYLQPNHYGNMRFEALPNDREEDNEDRWGLSFRHSSNFGKGWSGGLNINKVSDDDYFRDLSNNLSIATQTYLPREGYLQYASGWWNALARVQKYQTLQDPVNALPIPYDREPQILVNALNQDVKLLDLAFQGEFVSFTHPEEGVQEGRRTIAYPSISVPFVSSAGFITPKVGLHSTWYNLSDVGGGEDRTPNRSVPIYSLDSGLFFERESNWLGRDWIQTLEPRLYYLNVPFRDQDDLPSFDTSLADLSFSQFFSENIFVGGDRIAEANQLTLAVTSRLIEPQTGQEIIRALIGQRYYFEDQRVTLADGQSGRRTSSKSSILGAFSGRVARDWTVDTAVQYDPSQAETERFNASIRYSPAPASIANVSYRYTNENQTTIGKINSIDVSAQWPLAQGWYGMARLNYDIDGDKLVERLAGIEYNAGCWILRLVYHQFQTSTLKETNVFFVQLELNGFSRIGSNPLDTLRRNVPGYVPSNYVDENAVNAFDRSEIISPWGSGPGLGY
ncbi:MAG TPA: LPS-assembly protein LptD [Burkholderiales bacterium]|nr:LPS-assembly protein LptD [Burkholderiales bacterium]